MHSRSWLFKLHELLLTRNISNLLWSFYWFCWYSWCSFLVSVNYFSRLCKILIWFTRKRSKLGCSFLKQLIRLRFKKKSLRELWIEKRWWSTAPFSIQRKIWRLLQVRLLETMKLMLLLLDFVVFQEFRLLRVIISVGMRRRLKKEWLLFMCF